MKRLPRWSMGAARAGAVLLVSLWGSAALAEQIVVLDETWVHGPDMPDSHYRVVPAAGTPSNWVSPVDYSQGTAWVYLEVHTKPTDQPTKFQVCFEATPTYACTAQSPTYTEIGTYEWSTKFSDFWSPPGESVDWTQGVNKIACILKDTMNNKPSADNVGPETAALYMPTEVRMVVTIVEPGGVYKPPTPTGEGGSGGTGGAGGNGGTGGNGTGGSGGNGNGTGGAGTGGDAGGNGNGSGGGGASGGLNDSDGGCSLAPRSEGAATGWIALAAAALLAGRRRRNRTAAAPR